MKPNYFIIIITCIVLVGITPFVMAQVSHSQALDKISPHVLATTENGKATEFFVILDDNPDLTATAKMSSKVEKGTYVYHTLRSQAQTSQANLKAWLDEQNISYRSFYIVNAILLEGTHNLAMTLAKRSDVVRIEANPKVPGISDPIITTDTSLNSATGIEPGVSYINADDVWALGFAGEGIIVGGQDTGYEWDHPAIKQKYRGWDGDTADHDYNWHDSVHSNGGSNPCGVDSPEPCDDNSHGTHTMGTVLGDDGGNNQIGVAPEAKWIGCRDMDAGLGSPATYLECFEFFLAPYPVDGTPDDGDPSKAPHITANSWSCPAYEGCSTDTLQAAVDAHYAAGIMTVVSAGNDGSGCSTIAEPISIYEHVYTVGALNTGADTLASFSGRGPVTIDGSNRLKPDIAAPGTNTRSSILNGNYGTKSGTSMASPHVSGAVALLWSAVPSLKNDIDNTIFYLNENAVPIESTSCSSSGSPNNLFGHGRLDILASVEHAQNNILTADFSYSTPVYVEHTVVFTNLSYGALPITFTWNFGDGITSVQTRGTVLLPTYYTYQNTGKFTVALTATNIIMQDIVTKPIDVITKPLDIPPIKPIASFTYTYPAIVNQPITFTSLYTGTEPLTITWDFGDGTPPQFFPFEREKQSTLLDSPLLVGERQGVGYHHTYSHAGIYTVTLMLENEAGKNTAIDTIHVYQPGVALMPPGGTSLQPFYQEGNADEVFVYPLTVTNTGDITDTVILSFTGDWSGSVDIIQTTRDIPDVEIAMPAKSGTTIQVHLTPAMTITEMITENLVITATSKLAPDYKASITLIATVHPVTAPTSIPPNANFIFPDSLQEYENVIFTNLTTGMQPITSIWNFGDSAVQYLQYMHAITITHVYSETGMYAVTLTATNEIGQDVMTKDVLVRKILYLYLPLILK